MSKTLKKRFEEERAAFVSIQEIAGLKADQLPKLLSELILDQDPSFSHWLMMLESLEYAQLQLDNPLRWKAEVGASTPAVTVPIVPFQHARLLSVQAYLSTSWALVDSVVVFSGRILTVSRGGVSIELLKHFVSNGKSKDDLIESDKVEKNLVPMLLRTTIRNKFGWPIAISRKIRNIFAHNGGRIKGSDFFEGSTEESAFRISKEAWQKVVAEAKIDCADGELFVRSGWELPATPESYLREVLKLCQIEIDAAVGVILATAIRDLDAHVRSLLEEDVVEPQILVL